MQGYPGIINSTKLPQTWMVLPELLRSIRGAKFFYLVLFFIRQRRIYEKRGGMLPNSVFVLPDEGFYVAISPHSEEVGEEEIVEIPRLPSLACISYSTFLLGNDAIVREVRRQVGPNPHSVHWSINPMELKILIRVPREEIVKENFFYQFFGPFDPEYLFFKAFTDFGNYSLGLTSLVECEGNRMMHLPLVDSSLPLEICPKTRWREEFKAEEAIPDPSEFARIYYKFKEEFAMRQGLRFKDVIQKLGLRSGVIINSGNSFQFFSNELMSPKGWLGFMRELEQTPGADSDWSFIQRNFCFGLTFFNRIEIHPLNLGALGFSLLRIAMDPFHDKSVPVVWDTFIYSKYNTNQLDLFFPESVQLSLF